MNRIRLPNLNELVTQIDLNHSRVDELDIYVFPQVWGSTALGFGGIGGQAMTKALTTVIYDPYNDTGYVFFDGELAYFYEHPSDKFFDDIRKMSMLPCSASYLYREGDYSNV